MSCIGSLQIYGIQGLIIGACLGAGFAIYKWVVGDTSESQVQKQIVRLVSQFGMVGCVLGLIYAAIKDCVNLSAG